jgi:hypothetical protein
MPKSRNQCSHHSRLETPSPPKTTGSIAPHLLCGHSEDLRKAVEKCKDNDAVKEVGVEWAIQQSRELIDFGALCLHFYTMGRSEQTRAIAKAIF